jgi:hypothetical protein
MEPELHRSLPPAAKTLRRTQSTPRYRPRKQSLANRVRDAHDQTPNSAWRRGIPHHQSSDTAEEHRIVSIRHWIFDDRGSHSAWVTLSDRQPIDGIEMKPNGMRSRGIYEKGDSMKSMIISVKQRKSKDADDHFLSRRYLPVYSLDGPIFL